METILIGMGNPVLTDDSVGLKIAQRVASLLAHSSGVAIRELYTGGISLMEALVGYDRAFIVDSMCTPGASAGAICSPTVNDLFHTRNTCSTHDGNLGVALELGKLAGLRLPSEIRIWGVEAADVTSFSEQLTPNVERAVPLVVEQVMHALQRSLRSGEYA